VSFAEAGLPVICVDLVIFDSECFDPVYLGLLRKNTIYGLTVRPGKSRCDCETFAVCKIEGDNLVVGDAIKIVVGARRASVAVIHMSASGTELNAASASSESGQI
jgi:hypothetical protein